MKERINKNKDDIIVILIMLLGLAFFTVVFKYKLSKFNYSEIKEKSIFLISVFSCIIYLVSIFFSMKKGDSFLFALKFLVPFCLGIGLCLVSSEVMVFVPYMLPVVHITVYLNSSIAFLFQAFLTIIYYFSGVFNGEITIMFIFFSIFCIYIVGKADNNEKYMFTGIISIIGYIFLNYIYQLYLFDEVKIKIIFNGLPALIISILPLYIKILYDKLYEKYIEKKIINLCDDENELFLCLMDIDSEAYVHSLKVADTAGKPLNMIFIFTSSNKYN